MRSATRKSPAIIKGREAQTSPQPVLTGPKAMLGGTRDGASGRAPRSQPEIKLRRNGELIEAIEITCPCGNHMVIECLYDPTIAEVTP
jgi:hypothetical protein